MSHLVSSCSEWYEAVFKLLLDNGAKVNGCNVDRDPLSVAIKNGHKKIVELLLSIEGINVNIGNKIGNISLHIASITIRVKLRK